jgi:general L-amino acid transport system ATP-binding protein
MTENSQEQSIIKCRDVHKWYGQFHALQRDRYGCAERRGDCDLRTIWFGQITFIRTLNRLEEHQRGQIFVDGVELTHDIRNIEHIRMETGMVFQSFNLFPHLTVMDNIIPGPDLGAQAEKANRPKKLRFQLLERVGIPEQAHKYPGAAFGWAAAAGRHRPRPGDAAQDHAV